MHFNSPLFLFLFLPLTLIGYWLLGRKIRIYFLLFGSLLYYAFYNIFINTLTGAKGESFILLLSYYIISNYLLGIWAAKYRETFPGKVVIWVTIVVNLLPLAWYKYSGFAASTVQSLIPVTAGNWFPIYQSNYIPLGISFLAFQAIAYVLDVYRDEISPQRNLFRFSLFMSLYPKITSGPIIRYSEIADELAGPTLQADQVVAGIKRFIIGLGKKVLLADSLALSANHIFSLPASNLTATVAWIGLLTYTLQIYLDFSGYTDMAIGLGNMFGFKLQENFNYPYVSKSLTEFWRRWHISLSTWLRDYLFVPLSYALITERVRKKISQGKYKTNYHTQLSIVIVFTVCGLWHGAGWNFILWGMLHGIILAIENLWLSKIMKRWWVPFQHAYLLLIVMLSWVLFRTPTISDGIQYYIALAGLSSNPISYYDPRIHIDSTEAIILVFGVIASMPTAVSIRDLLQRKGYVVIGAVCDIAGAIIITVLSYCYIASSTFMPFLYQRF